MIRMRDWVRQPTTVAGLSAVLGTVVALLLKQIDWIHAAPLLAGAAMSILLPDNSSAKQQAEDLATSIVCRTNNVKEFNR